MGDNSRPPGLADLPPGLANTSISGSNSQSNGHHGGVGRGKNNNKSNNQQNGGNAQGGGRGKKSQAKATATSAPSQGKSTKASNLSSFGTSSSETTASTANGSGGKRTGRESVQQQPKKAPGTTRVWSSGLSAEELAQAPACLTCCEPIEFFAVGVCNHNEVCAMCTIRRRQIYGDMDCCICKKALDQIVIDREGGAKFEELWANRVSFQVLSGTSICINDTSYFEFCSSLFERHCPLCKDDHKVYPSVNVLKKHAETAHGKVFCELCLNHRKCFLHEQVLYKSEQLPQHVEKGDPSIQLKPHPSCEYCSTVFFSMEDLFRHCEEAHFKCFICERDNVLYNYFKNYDHLDKHFVAKHFACREKDCLEKKFVVFPSALDLQAHNVSAHLPQEKKNAKNARVVHLDFSGSSVSAHSVTGSRQNGSGNASVINRPPQMPIFFPDRHRPSAAVKQAPNSSYSEPSSFSLAGKIDDPKPPATLVVNAASMSAPSQNSVLPAVAVLQQSHANLTASERSKNLISAVKAFLNNDAKFNKFRTISADYRNSKITAQTYYQQFTATFGSFMDISVTLIFDEMVDLLPDVVKRAELKSLRELDFTSQTGTTANALLSSGSAGSQHTMASRLQSSTGSGARVISMGGTAANTNTSSQNPSPFATGDFPTLSPGSGGSAGPSTSLSATNYGKATTGGLATDGPSEAFPALPGSDVRYTGRAPPAGPKGAWGTGSNAPASPAARKGPGKKGKGKQYISLY